MDTINIINLELANLLSELIELDKNIRLTEAQNDKIWAYGTPAKTALGEDADLIEEELKLFIMILPSAKKLLKSVLTKLLKWKNVNQIQFDGDELEVSEGIKLEELEEEQPIDLDQLDDELYLGQSHFDDNDDHQDNYHEDLDQGESDPLELKMKSNANFDSSETEMPQPPRVTKNRKRKAPFRKRRKVASKKIKRESQSKSIANVKHLTRNSRNRKISTNMNGIKPMQSEVDSGPPRLILHRLSLETLNKYNVTLPPPPSPNVKGVKHYQQNESMSDDDYSPFILSDGENYSDKNEMDKEDEDSDPSFGPTEFDSNEYSTRSKRRNLLQTQRQTNRRSSQVPKPSGNFHRFRKATSRKRNRGRTDFQCSKCGAGNFTHAEWIAHLKTHPKRTFPMSMSSLKCDLCPELSFNHRGLFVQHLVNEHELQSSEEDKPHSCLKCTKRFRTKRMYERHMYFYSRQITHPFACPVCEQRFESEIKLFNHKTVMHKPLGEPQWTPRDVKTIPGTKRPPKDKTYYCTGCSKGFTTVMTLRRHEQKVHINDKKVFCHACPVSNCGKTYSEAAFLSTHLNSHKPSGPYDCDYCLQTSVRFQKFDTAESLSLHLQVHAQEPTEKRHYCTECNVYHRSMRDYKLHMVRFHGAERKVQCPHCPKLLVDKGYLTKHLRMHERNLLISKGKVFEKNFICETKGCGKAFERKSQLRIHVEAVHEKKHVRTCPICSKVTTTFKLSNHMKRHQNIRNFVCYFCGKGFVANFHLKEHMSRHTMEKAYWCKLCPLSTSHKTMFRQHRLAHEAADRMKKAMEEAGKKGEEPLVLLTTIYNPRQRKQRKPVQMTDEQGQPLTVTEVPKVLLTTVAKPKTRKKREKFSFMCEICGKEIKSRRYVKDHMNSHYDIKDFVCYFCGIRFARLAYLFGHLNRHTLEKPFRCKLCDKEFIHKFRLDSHTKAHTKGTARIFKEVDKDGNNVNEEQNVLMPPPTYHPNQIQEQQSVFQPNVLPAEIPPQLPLDFQTNQTVIASTSTGTFNYNYNCNYNRPLPQDMNTTPHPPHFLFPQNLSQPSIPSLSLVQNQNQPQRSGQGLYETHHNQLNQIIQRLKTASNANMNVNSSVSSNSSVVDHCQRQIQSSVSDRFQNQIQNYNQMQAFQQGYTIPQQASNQNANATSTNSSFKTTDFDWMNSNL